MGVNLGGLINQSVQYNFFTFSITASSWYQSGQDSYATVSTTLFCEKYFCIILFN